MVIQRDDEKRQIKIAGDNGRVRWYPAYCFEADSARLLKVTSIHIDDPIRNAHLDSVEVTLMLTDGEREARRWCCFLTPAYVYTLFSDPTAPPESFGRHVIFVPVLTEDSIISAIRYLEAHNQLEACTLPLNKPSGSE